MRMIASTLLPVSTGPTFLQGELINKASQLPLPQSGADAFHIFCSARNSRALGFVAEFAAALRLKMVFPRVNEESRSRNPAAFEEALQLWKRLARGRLINTSSELRVTSHIEDLAKCDHFLVYLNKSTWTNGAMSDDFMAEVGKAMDAGVRLLLCHEMPGPGQESRGGCEFGNFFSETPKELLSRGLYAQIACPLKGSAFRETSMVIVMQTIISISNPQQDAPTVVGALSGSSRQDSGRTSFRLRMRPRLLSRSGSGSGSSDSLRGQQQTSAGSLNAMPPWRRLMTARRRSTQSGPTASCHPPTDSPNEAIVDSELDGELGGSELWLRSATRMPSDTEPSTGPGAAPGHANDWSELSQAHECSRQTSRNSSVI